MSTTLFRMALYASLGLCALGILWRISTWFRVRIGPDARAVPVHQRLVAVLRDGVSALASRRVLHVLRAVFWDTLLQGRLFASEKLRWLGHLLILAGFTLLLLMHALAAVLTGKLFPDYQPTLDPFQFLRNVFGAMVVAGVVLVFAGRWRRRTGLPRARRAGDRVFVGLLAIVILSGFLLEAQKIASPRAFYRMADEYLGTTDPEELRPLRTAWATDFGVAFDDVPAEPDPDVLKEGREYNADTCASCHTPPRSAFVSWPTARALAPVIGPLDDAQADRWLYYLHVFACFLGLAVLPFTRLFHAVADPASLLANGAAPAAGYSAAGRASRRALALDACVGCGICDTHCSVAPVARQLGNPALLPSHKLRLAWPIASGALLRRDAPRAGKASEGAFLCTSCGRCTARCPVGLDLEDLWAASRADLVEAGLPAPAAWVQARPAVEWAEALATRSAADDRAGPLSADRNTFSKCVQCQTCTNVCPVVAASVTPDDGVDLTPQKVMNLLRLGLRDLALGSRMVWNCATCYQCQENCPEGIRVTDVMCELRNLAYRRLGEVRDRRRPT